ncbi:MAG: hypothetical protein MET45_29260 [Nostoc sp. LLA-1]|nr:hypothetical protein [Cyanocohniella sp. LLY]
MPTICPLPTGMKVKASLAATKLAPNNKLYGVTSMVNKTNPTQSNNTVVRSLMNIALSLGVMLGSGLAYGFVQTAFYSKQHEQSAQAELGRFGRAEYEQLKPGMSLTEVRSILYRGVEVSRSATIATFVWENPDGSKITVTFEHDRLKSKAQSGLK